MARRRAPALPPPPETVLRGHSSGVQGVCFLNEDTVLSGDESGLVKVWNLERRRACAEFSAHSLSTVLRLERFDDRRVVSQGRDGVIKVWDAERLVKGQAGNASRSESWQTTSTASLPELIQSIVCGSYTFCTFALTRWRDATTAVELSGMHHASSEDGDAVGDGMERPKPGRRRRQKCSSSSAYDPGREEQKNCGQRKDDPAVQGFKMNVKGRAPRNDGVRGEEEEEEKEEEDDGWGSTVAQGAESSTSGSFAANTLLAPCSEHHTMALWDIRAKTRAYDITPTDPTQNDMVLCARLLGESPSSASPLAVCGHDYGALCVYDLRAASAEPLIHVRLHKEPVLCVDIGSSGKQGVSGSAGNNIHVFKLDAKKALCEVKKTFQLEHPGTSCVEIRQDEKLFMSGGWDHRVRVFSWTKAPRPLAVLRSHDETVFNIAYSPRTGVFASSSKDCRVALWNIFPDRGK